MVGAKLARDKLSDGSDPERAFRLYKEEPVPDGIRRIARGQLDSAAEELGGASSRKLGEAIHDARKRLKRLRASVRVARGALGDEAYRRANTGFRKTGQMLSGVRDARVLVDTLDGLVDRFGKELSPEAIAPLRARLEREHKQALKSLKDDDGGVDLVVRKLKNARGRTANWTFETDGFAALAPGLRQIYRRGRRAMRKAGRNPTTANLHELRKRVKDLWYALEIVYPAAPKATTKLAKRAHRLSDLLGDDHDLAVLREYVLAHPELLEDPTRAALVALIDRRRRALQRDGLRLAKRVYKRPPKRFVRGLEQGWKKRVPAPEQQQAAAVAA